MQITIINRQKKIPISSRAIKKITHKVLKILKADLSGEITIALVDNKAIRELNFRFLGKDAATDVLCFDISSYNKFIADIVISTEKVCENSQIFKTTRLKELKLYLIHGILHLLGFKDYDKRQRQEMHRKALGVLKRI